MTAFPAPSAHDHALAAFAAGEVEEAHAVLRAALAADLPVDLLNDLAVMTHRLGRPADARVLLQAGLVLEPGHADLVANLQALDAANRTEESAAARTAFKEQSELAYWSNRKAIEGTLANESYAFLYTDHFGLDGTFFSAKRILDVGCGPRREPRVGRYGRRARRP